MTSDATRGVDKPRAMGIPRRRAIALGLLGVAVIGCGATGRRSGPSAADAAEGHDTTPAADSANAADAPGAGGEGGTIGRGDSGADAAPSDAAAPRGGAGGQADAAFPSDAAADKGLYTPGTSAFIVSADEPRVMLDISSGNLADAQAQIDGARAAMPAAMIVVKMSGLYLVSSSPLRLPSSVALLLSGTLRAAPGASAAALLSIDGQSKVSVSGGTLDGAGVPLNGLRVQTSRKIAIDGLVIRNTGREGIAWTGPGAAVWDGGSTLTRLEVSGCAAGITVRDATRVLVIDSFVHDNTGVGVAFGAGASFGAIVHDRASGNTVGIQVDGADNAVSDNTLTGNGTGIQLGAASASNACLQNQVLDSTAAGLRLGGGGNLVYANRFRGSAPPLLAAGAGNSVVPEGAPLAAGSNSYFYPPTIANPHQDPIVAGKQRTDVTVNGGSLAEVQTRYDAARAAHPDDVIVLHLKGAFTQAGAPFLLSSFTSVLLDGTIDVTAAAGPAITGGPGLQFTSFSGGTIDAHNQVMEGISLQLGTLVVLDHVTVKNFGRQSPRSTSNSIRMQGGAGYSIIRGCTVDVSGGRAIWTENASSRYIVVGNTVTHANMDGIDFDAHTANSLAKDNVADGNTRSGLFIEEGAAFNKAYANVFSNTASHGINLYSNVAGKSSHQNLAFCNAITGNNNGIRIGAINGNTTSDTFLFDNVVTGSKGSGLTVDPIGSNNYSSSNVLGGNHPDFTLDPMGGADFFNPPPAP
jgi:hypothetical protein